ncbi:hypothetical protein lwe2750 [Listeria welshimeri serovar 6b str. SLCC5334]|uniref:Uncharacterized protein n=1 Tax=Listeria welshimeri serovar 6b (strain ATCC 35897 / DSM 20650 / CCUG 15529 / CIP 8149 / NCTC 11857 / SLCC 5334 / V8) TaxID=386043 RepID=A0AMD6_LISW6|nr:hypothetical protein lwe2750 [Listeria welshimeri serovar 6b str. SLCC5334]
MKKQKLQILDKVTKRSILPYIKLLKSKKVTNLHLKERIIYDK